MAEATCSKCGASHTFKCPVCGCPKFKDNNDGGILGAFTGSKTVRCKNCGVCFPAVKFCECGGKIKVPTVFF